MTIKALSSIGNGFRLLGQLRRCKHYTNTPSVTLYVHCLSCSLFCSSFSSSKHFPSSPVTHIVSLFLYGFLSICFFFLFFSSLLSLHLPIHHLCLFLVILSFSFPLFLLLLFLFKIKVRNKQSVPTVPDLQVEDFCLRKCC